MGEQMMNDNKTNYAQKSGISGTASSEAFSSKRKIKGYAALAAIVLSLIAMIFWTFVPLIATSAVILLFIIRRKLNISGRFLGCFVLLLIVGSLLAFAVVPMIKEKGITGKSVDEPNLLMDIPSEEQMQAPQIVEENNDDITEMSVLPLGNMAESLKVEDGSGKSVDASIKLNDAKGTITLEPKEGAIKKIEFNSLSVEQGKPVALKLEKDVKKENKRFAHVYAIDPTALNFTNATVTVTAIGNSLFKCKNWSFESQTCNGRWKKIADIIPGQDYKFTLTADDPGFGEGNYTVTVLDKNNTLLDYNETVFNITGDVENIKLDLSNHPIKSIEIHGHNASIGEDTLIVDYKVNLSSLMANETGLEEAILIDSTNLSFSNNTIKVKMTAKGKDLFKCDNWTNEECEDNNWTKVKDLVPNETYNLSINKKGEDIFAESKRDIVLLDKDLKLLRYKEETINVSGHIKDIQIEMINIQPKWIKIYRHNESKNQNDLNIQPLDKSVFGFNYMNAYALDPTGLDQEYAEVSANATGKSLLKCADFNFTTQTCQGSWKIVMKITPGKEYTFNFTSTDPAYAEGNNTIAVLDKNNTLLDYNETLLNENGDFADVEIIPKNHNIKKIIIKNHNKTSEKNSLKIEGSTNEAGFIQSYSIDPTSLDFENANVTVTAIGTDLYKCKNWNFSSQTCIDGNWTLFKTGLVPGEQYTFTLTADDPGFAETSKAMDVDIIPISNKTFIVAWVDNAERDISFKVMDTNGSIIVNTTDADLEASNATSRVSISAINATHFVIAWSNSTNRLNYAIYNISGSKIFGPTTINTDTEVKNDISIAQLADRFVICYTIGPNILDASFQIFYNNGTQSLAETDIDTAVGDSGSQQNQIKCSAINDTSWLYSYVDYTSADIIYETRNHLGTNILANTIIDPNAGEGQVTAMSLNNDRFVIFWYDSVSLLVEMTIIRSGGTQILAPATIASNPGASKVAVARVRENATATEDWYIASWGNSSVIRSAVYNSTGSQKTAPFTAASNQDSTAALIEMAGRTRLGASLYPGTFTLAYTNTSNAGVYKNFYINGSEWDGIITAPQIIPLVSITYPANTTYNINVSSLNYTVSNAQTCWYSLDNGITNSSVTCGINLTGLTSAEGSNTWRVYVNDTAGNQNSSSVTFSKDTTPPAISITYPANTTYNVNVSALNYTSGSSDCSRAWYSRDSGATNSTSVACGTNFTSVTSVEGSNTWRVYVNDTAGNQNSSSMTFSKDTGKPLWSNPSRNETTVYNGMHVKFNATWSNAQLAGYIFSINQTGTWQNSSYIPFSGTTNVSENVSLITANAGTNVTWYFWANDTAGNSNQTDVQSFVVQSRPTSVVISVNQTVYPQGRSPSHGYDVYIPFQARYSDNSGQPITGAVCNVTNNETSDITELTYNATTGNYTGQINDYMMYSVVGFNVTCSKANYNPAVNYTTTNVWWFNYLWEWQNVSYGAYNFYTTHWLKKEAPSGQGYILTQNITTSVGDNDNLLEFPFCGAGTNCSFLKEYNMRGLHILRLNLSISNASCSPYLCIAVRNWYNNKLYEKCGLPQAIPENAPVLIEQNITADYSIAQNEYLVLRTYLNCSAAASESVNFYYNYTNQPANIEIRHAAPREIRSSITAWTQIENNYTVGPNANANVTRKWWITFNNSLSSAEYMHYWFKPQILAEYPNLNINNTIYVWNSTGQLWASDNASAGAPNIATSHADNQVDWYTEIIPALTAINETLQKGVLNAIRDNEILITNLTHEKKWSITARSVFIPQVMIYNVTVWTNYSTYDAQDDFEFNVSMTNSSGIFDISDQVTVNSTAKTITMPLTHLSEVNYTITARDRTAPTVHLISPANGTMTNVALQTFSCNITNIAIANLALYIWNSTDSNIHTNTTVLSGTFNQTSWQFTLPYDNSFKWNCLGYDSQSNSNWSDEGNYTITLDTTPPYVSFISPLNQTYNNKTLLVNISASDTNIDKIWFFNGTANVTYTTPVYANFGEGSNTLYAYANDSAGSMNSTSVTFTVDIIAPGISITYPANTTYNVNVSSLNYTVSGAQSCWYSLNNGQTNTSVICGTNLTGLTSIEGSNTWKVYANDSAGNLNSSSVTFFKDTIPPSISIISPLNQTYTNRTLLVNISASDSNGISSRWFNWNGTNQTYASETYVTFAEGNNTLTAYANDSAGNLNSSSVTFSIDTTPPYVIINTPENRTYNNATRYISIASDGVNVWFFNGTANETYIGPVSRVFAEGSNTLYAWANDSLGNVNQTSVIFYIDTVYPSMYIISPQNITYGASQILVNLTNSENASMFFFNGTANVTYTNHTYVNYTHGSHVLIAYANDSAGNLNSTSVQFVVDIYDPTVTINSPLNQTYRNSTILIDITAINTMDFGIDKIWFFNGTANETYTAPIYKTFNQGSNTLYAWANDTAGNVGRANITFFVDSISPSISIASPANATYNNRTLLVNISANDINLQTRWFNWNGTNQTYNSETYVTFAEGTNVLTAYANDSIGNMNQTSVTFTTDTTPPYVIINQPQNQTYNNATRYISIASDGEYVWFFNGTANETYIGPVSRVFAEGSNTLYAWANDSLGNVNQTSVTFTIDTIAPAISNVASRVILNQAAMINWTTDELSNSTVRYGTALSLISSNSSSENALYHEIYLSGLNPNILYYYNVTSCDAVGNCRTSGYHNFTTSAIDAIAPTFTSTAISPYAVLTSRNVLLNATATDNVAVSSIIANVTLPNGTSAIVNVPAYFNATLAGRYNVIFIANDTSGNAAYSSDVFDAGFSNISIQFNVLNSNLTGITNNLTIYLSGTNNIVHAHNFSGGYADYHVNVLYDLLFDAINSAIKVRLNRVNLTLDNNRTLGIDRTIITGYLMTYAVNNTYNMTNADLEISYANTSYSNEDNLKVEKCPEWVFESRICNSAWQTVSAASQNKTAKTFSFTVTGFSAFSIKEEVPSVAPIVSGGGIIRGIIEALKPCEENWQCTLWSECRDYQQTRTCTDLNRCGTLKGKPVEVSKCDLQTVCFDQILNNGESDVDCGGELCDKCENGKNCFKNADCKSGICESNACKEEVSLPAPGLKRFNYMPYLFVLIVVLAAVIIYSATSRMIYTIETTHFDRKLDEYIKRQRETAWQKARGAERRARRRMILYAALAAAAVLSALRKLRRKRKETAEKVAMTERKAARKVHAAGEAIREGFMKEERAVLRGIRKAEEGALSIEKGAAKDIRKGREAIKLGIEEGEKAIAKEEKRFEEASAGLFSSIRNALKRPFKARRKAVEEKKAVLEIKKVVLKPTVRPLLKEEIGITRKPKAALAKPAILKPAPAKEEEKIMIPEEKKPAIRLNMAEYISNKAYNAGIKIRGLFKRMFERKAFDRELMGYLHKQRPSELGIEVVRKEKMTFSKEVEESIRRRKEFAERQRFEAGGKAPFFQRKAVRNILKPFIPIFERSKPEDFAVHERKLLAEKQKAEEKPKESKVMGMAIRLDKLTKEDSSVKTLLKEISEEEVKPLVVEERKKAKDTVVRDEKAVEEKKESGQKGLLINIPTDGKDKQQSIKKYMLKGLKEAYA